MLQETCIDGDAVEAFGIVKLELAVQMFGIVKSYLFFLHQSSKDIFLLVLAHLETVSNSKKLQTTTEMWLLKDFEIQIAQKTLWKKVKLLILSSFT